MIIIHSTLEASLRLFHSVINVEEMSTDEANKTNPENIKLAKMALKEGLVLDNKLLALSTDDLEAVYSTAVGVLGAETYKLNQSFYRSFTDVDNASDFELRLSQLLNYMTVYTDQGYVPNANTIFTMNNKPANLLDVQDALAVVNLIDADEATEKINKILASGSALSEQMQNDLITLINELNLKIDIDKIKNKQMMLKLLAKMWLSTGKGAVPHDFSMATRLLLAVASEGRETQLINKSRIQRSDFILIFKGMDSKQKDILNILFEKMVLTIGEDAMMRQINRYHVFYLQLKHGLNARNTNTVNRLFRKSKSVKHIKAKLAKSDRLLELTANGISDEELQRILDHVTTYKLIKIINAMATNKITTEADYRHFIIRNGSSYLASARPSYLRNKSYAQHIMSLALATLIKRVKGNFEHSILVLPRNINYALPTTTKTMVGSVPYMSAMQTKGKTLTVGVSWDRDCDIDLHAHLLKSYKQIGWNSSFRDDDHLVMHSGDMTALVDGHAAEYITANADVDEPIIFTAECYSDHDTQGVDFDLFLSGQDMTKKLSPDTGEDESQMVTKIDSNVILAKHIPFSKNQRSRNLAIAIPKKDHWDVYITGTNFGNTRIPYMDRTQILLQVLNRQANATIRLADLIYMLSKEDLDFVVTYDDNKIKEIQNSASENGQDPYKVIDLRTNKLDQSTFFDLISENQEQEK